MIYSSSRLIVLLRKCRLNQPEAKEELCAGYYDFAQTICDPFVTEKEDLNDVIYAGFAKSFLFIDSFIMNKRYSFSEFETWLRKMMLFAVIDYLRNHFALSHFFDRDPYWITRKQETLKLTMNNATLKRHSMKRADMSSFLFLHLHLVHGFTVNDFVQCFGIPVTMAEKQLYAATGMVDFAGK